MLLKNIESSPKIKRNIKWGIIALFLCPLVWGAYNSFIIPQVDHYYFKKVYHQATNHYYKHQNEFHTLAKKKNHLLGFSIHSLQFTGEDQVFFSISDSFGFSPNSDHIVIDESYTQDETDFFPFEPVLDLHFSAANLLYVHYKDHDSTFASWTIQFNGSIHHPLLPKILAYYNANITDLTSIQGLLQKLDCQSYTEDTSFWQLGYRGSPFTSELCYYFPELYKSPRINAISLDAYAYLYYKDSGIFCGPTPWSNWTKSE